MIMEIIEIEIPKYNSDNGIEYKWESGFHIETQIEDGIIKIIANKAGLLSLANHLLNLAQDTVPSDHHLHFDEYNSLEDGSAELIIEKK